MPSVPAHPEFANPTKTDTQQTNLLRDRIKHCIVFGERLATQMISRKLHKDADGNYSLYATATVQKLRTSIILMGIRVQPDTKMSKRRNKIVM